MTEPIDEPEPVPSSESEKPSPIGSQTISKAEQHNRRIGLVLCAIYALIYSGFVLINAFAADRMESQVVAGLNLAVVYGMFLIVLAFVFAMIYGFLCKTEIAIADDEENPAK